MKHLASRRTPRRTSATKLLASIALVAGAAGVAGLGTYGEFTDSTTAAQQTNAGVVEIRLDTPTPQGLGIAAANGMVPGDFAQRAVTLTQTQASQDYRVVSLATSAAQSNLLTNDKTNGLQLRIDQCSAVPTMTSDGRSLTCANAVQVLSGPVTANGERDLANQVHQALNTSGKSYLRVTLTFPDSAGNEFQGLSNNLTFTFTAKQRLGQAV